MFIREKRGGAWSDWSEVDRMQWISAGRRKGLRPATRGDRFAGKDIEGRITKESSK
jgi:hypothetical protein